MIAAVALGLPGAMIAYCLGFAIYCWFKHGSDRVKQLLSSEHRDKPDRVVAALTACNPAYRFRRYSSDMQLVTHPRPEARSIVAEQSR